MSVSIKRISVLFIITAMLLCMIGCDRGTQEPSGATLAPESTQNPQDGATTDPETTSKTDVTPGANDIVLTTFTAEELIPYIQAILESYMLKYNGSTVFKPQDVTVEAANAYIYAYAQANAYSPSMDGAMMSEYEVEQLLSVAFGDAYTYERLVSDADAGKLTCTLSDGIWDFGGGESYAPTVDYKNDNDIIFDENTPIYYEYHDVFDDNIAGEAVVYLVQNTGNMIGYSIAKIELVATKG